MLNLLAATLTDAGRARDTNEDRVWAQVYTPSQGVPLGLFVVCDGMGGHLGGEFASQLAIEAIKQALAGLFSPKDPRATVMLSQAELEAEQASAHLTRRSAGSEIEAQVQRAVQKANSVVYTYARQKPHQAGDAGTTVTLALVQGRRAVIANVGDSRTYLLRDQKLQQITQDHSLVASLAAAGQIQPEEIYIHPQRNMIYRSLGQKGQVQLDIFVELLKPGDYLLLCSDGFWEMVHDPVIIARLVENASDPAQACQNLVEAANAAGGEDNIGVVVVKVVE